MIEEIKKAIHNSALSKEKTAMFHFQVLKNAAELEGLNPEEFCKKLGLPSSYKTEFNKMLNLARIMKKHGITFK